MQSVNMSVSNTYSPDLYSTQYLNYGVAASEVNLLLAYLTVCETMFRFVWL